MVYVPLAAAANGESRTAVLKLQLDKRWRTLIKRPEDHYEVMRIETGPVKMSHAESMAAFRENLAAVKEVQSTISLGAVAVLAAAPVVATAVPTLASGGTVAGMTAAGVAKTAAAGVGVGATVTSAKIVAEYADGVRKFDLAQDAEEIAVGAVVGGVLAPVAVAAPLPAMALGVSSSAVSATENFSAGRKWSGALDVGLGIASISPLASTKVRSNISGNAPGNGGLRPGEMGMEGPNGWKLVRDPAPSKVPHGNSLDYVGETHVYRIKGPDGSTYKIGESMQGTRVRDGASIRGEAQVRALRKETGEFYQSEIRQTFPDKASARDYETRVIDRYRRMFGDDTLPGNRTNR